MHKKVDYVDLLVYHMQTKNNFLGLVELSFTFVKQIENIDIFQLPQCCFVQELLIFVGYVKIGMLFKRARDR